jgi:hypothetical protein
MPPRFKNILGLIMDDIDIEMLNKYGQEIGLADGLTLTELIESHRTLRELNKKHQATWLEALVAARQQGLEEGRSMAVRYEFISREKLKDMTLKDISDFLREED